ncbi:MAG: 4'-phosphopantetheinyl transferase superfamily protein, partial [Cyclobacteriaceae bacterium]
QKRSEWVAARLMLRTLCSHMKISYNGTRNDSNGKPFLQGHAIEISLTHSFPYVAVIADPRSSVGIDLEQSKEKLLRIAPRFLNDRELGLCRGEVSKILSFWCAKEALYKIYSKKGLNFRDEIHLYPDSSDHWLMIEGIIHKNDHESKYDIRCDYGKDYTMAYNI